MLRFIKTSKTRFYNLPAATEVLLGLKFFFKKSNYLIFQKVSEISKSFKKLQIISNFLAEAPTGRLPGPPAQATHPGPEAPRPGSPEAPSPVVPRPSMARRPGGPGGPGGRPGEIHGSLRRSQRFQKDKSLLLLLKNQAFRRTKVFFFF